MSVFDWVVSEVMQAPVTLPMERDGADRRFPPAVRTGGRRGLGPRCELLGRTTIAESGIRIDPGRDGVVIRRET